MAENDSNLLIMYKASPFSNIGQKMSMLIDQTVPLAGKTIDLDETAGQSDKLKESAIIDLYQARIDLAKSPTAKTNPFTTVDIDKVQADFLKIIVEPFGTVLALNSQYGNIIVKPYQSLSRFFDLINEPKTVMLGTDSKLIKMHSSFGDFIDEPYKSLIRFDSPSGQLSVVNFIPNTVNTGFTANALKGITEFFMDKVPGVNLALQTPDKSVAKTITMPVTPEKPIGKTELALPTPVKTVATLPAMPVTPNKPFASLREIPATPDKTVANLILADTTPSKFGQASDIHYVPLTGQKIPVTADTGKIAPEKPTPPKDAGKIQLPPIVPPKVGANLGLVNYIPDTYQTNFTPEQQFGQTQFKLDIDTSIPNALVIREPNIKTYVGDKALPSFTTKDAGALQKTEYTNADIPGFDTFMIGVTPYGFDFKNRIGVINQFDQYAKNYLDVRPGEILTTGGYAKILANRILFRSPGPENFFTPMVALNDMPVLYRQYPPDQSSSEYRGYSDPESVARNSMPLWERLVNVGTALTAEFVGASITNLVQQVTGVDTSPAKVSPLGMHIVAGDIFYSISGFKGNLEAYKQSSTKNPASNVLPTVLTDAIGAVTGVVRGIQQASTILGISLAKPGELLSNDYAELGLVMSQILAGTKYTAAYAFYDPTVKQYSSRWAVTGDNAVNLYYNDNARIDEVNDGGKYSSTGVQLFDAAGKIDNAFKLSIYSRYANIDKSINQGGGSGISSLIGQAVSVAQTVQGAVTTAANFINRGVFNLLTEGNPSVTRKQGERILGQGFEQLVNPAMLIEDSLTFGTYNIRLDPTRLYEYWIPLKDDTNNKNTNGAISPDINYNFDTPLKALGINIPDVSALPISGIPTIKLPPPPTSLAPLGAVTQTALKSGGTGISNTINSLGMSIANPFSKNDFKNLYSDKLKSALNDRGNKNIQDRGIPSDNGNDGGNYEDWKNLEPLQKLHAKDGKIEEYKDTDLIDFYFEDVSSFGDSTTNILMAFRAILTNYADNTNADWQTHTYIGRPDKFYIYAGFDRKVAVSFDIAINSKKEFIPVWQKLNHLQGMCYPVAYPKGVSMRAPILAITIGNLLNRVSVVMNNVNFNFDQSSLWEIEKGFQLPMYIKVGVDFNVLFDSIPLAEANHFAQNQPWILVKKSSKGPDGMLDYSGVTSNSRKSLAIDTSLLG